jgi:hypothetical protein
MNAIKYLLAIFMVTCISCEKEKIDGIQNIENHSIKSEVLDGKTTSRYIYNSIGKISEREGLYFYSRYLYDIDGRLIKRESAMDPSMLSSSLHVEKAELMTSQNCAISTCNIFKYDQEEKLIEIKNYTKKNGHFVDASMRSFKYNGDLIVRRNLYNSEGNITHFNTYEYDNNGNVERKKYYSYLFTEGPEPRIISETSYKYDNKKPPFIIFKALGNPGLYTNANNVIETNSISHVGTPGIDKYSTSKTAYEYNRKNYPVKVIGENSEYEYQYY